MRYFLPELLLLHAAYTDLRTREISGVLLLIFGVSGLFCMMFGTAIDLPDACFGAALGLIMMGISYLTHGELGMGDGMIIVITGMYLGLRGNIVLLLGSLILSAVFSVILLICGKKMKQEYPFIPFIFLTYSTMLLGGSFG